MISRSRWASRLSPVAPRTQDRAPRAARTGRHASASADSSQLSSRPLTHISAPQGRRERPTVAGNRRSYMRSATCTELGSGQALFAQLALRPVGLGETLEAHAAQNLRRFRELDIAVVDDLDMVSPGVDEVETASGLDLRTGLFERL